MSKTNLVYRGVHYDATHHETPAPQPVEHVYRGVHYREPLRHEPAPIDETVDLHYRGHVYHHRQAEATRELHDA
jgi:hypothetical protein